MKKTITFLLLLTSMVFLISGCQSSEAQSEPEPVLEFSIPESQLQSICKLATLKCYYNNVAKTTLEGNFLQKDSKLWIEYSGTVDMGVDFSKVKLEMDGNKLIITMPDAKVLNVNDPEINDNSYYFSQQGILSAKVNAEDERDAFKEAQNNMKQIAEDSTTLLQTAKARAKLLIENYVHQMDELAGTEHTIIWKDVA